MDIKLNLELPPEFLKSKVSGIYKIQFDNGMFYIGSSLDVQSRFYSWAKYFSGKYSQRSQLSKKAISKVCKCSSAVMTLVKEVLGGRDELFFAEELEIHKHNESSFLLNQIFFPKRAVIKCLKDGSVVERFDSVQSCFNKIGGYFRRLQRVLNGEGLTIKGYVYKYENPEFWPKPKISKKHLPGYVHPNGKSVNKYDRDGSFICQYASCAQAARSIGVYPGDLRKHILGKIYFNGIKGFVFKYA